MCVFLLWYSVHNLSFFNHRFECLKFVQLLFVHLYWNLGNDFMETFSVKKQTNKKTFVKIVLDM